MAIEEPRFDVVGQVGDVELRAYAPYVVAEVTLTGSAEDTGNQGFRILAGYIFGKNQGEQRLAMTAPVAQVRAPVKLEMTAPVIQQAEAGSYVVQFVLPADVTLATAPRPQDPRIVLRENPAKRVAVIRYSGTWSKANYDEHLAKLRQALESARLVWTGEPVYARYDPPFKPWFLRRNEIWLELAGETAPAAH
ncbi:MAG: heme-binding protein [Gammaproteobacteria bacterium]|nr:heme-binding protein [Gammaproteobacteria bacterium]